MIIGAWWCAEGVLWVGVLDTTRLYTRPSRAEMTAALDHVTVEW